MTVWTEKYRPATLAEVIGQEDIVAALRGYLAVRDLPHLLLTGPAGTGKTSTAIAFARELLRDKFRGNFKELNASDERGLSVVRHEIKEFASTRPLDGSPFKVIFLDEVDGLTKEAQEALRRTMETCSPTVRFVLAANYAARIIEPLHSRCVHFRFKPLKPSAMKAALSRIAHAEGVGGDLDSIIRLCGGDLRRAINVLQGDGSSAKAAEGYSERLATQGATTMLEKAVRGDLHGARTLLAELHQHGLGAEDVLVRAHQAAFDLALPAPARAALMERIAEAEFRIAQGCNERLQLEAVLGATCVLASVNAVTVRRK